MRRSALCQVAVYCPHFQRTVTAQRNQVIDRLVACDESARCREPVEGGPEAQAARPYPAGCPVYPSLAKGA
jgi:hypothetical protein